MHVCEHIKSRDESPLSLNHFHAEAGCPPLHPIDIPHVRPAQQATVSSGENTVEASPVAIQ